MKAMPKKRSIRSTRSLAQGAVTAVGWYDLDCTQEGSYKD